MRGWLWTGAAALAAAWVVGAVMGLTEAGVQWLHFGAPSALPGAGAARVILPPAIVCGWGGLLAAVFVFPAVGLLARRARRPRRVAFGAAVGGAAASLVTVWAAYALREHLMPAWWAAHGAVAGKGLLALLWLGVTALVARAVARLSAGLARRQAWLLALPLALIVAGAAAWPHWRADEPRWRTAGLARDAAVPSGAPNVLLLTIDAWRRDHLTCVAAGSPPTPHFDALAAQGTLFTNAWTPSPWTLPAAGSLLTGLPPRALDLRQYRPLPAGVPSLATIAWGRGWETAAFVTNPYLSAWYGFDRGFAQFEHSLLLEPLGPAGHCLLVREATRYAELHDDADEAGVVVPKVTAWLRRQGRERPFFLWVHLLDPHLPYTWRELPPDDSPALAPVRGVAPRRDAIPDTGVFCGRSFTALRAVREGTWVPDDAARRGIADLYAREVQYADAWAGRLLAELRRLGLWERTLVVLTADHGEELFDHGGLDHGHSLLPEVTGVPLIVRYPDGRGAGRVVSMPVSLLDIAPTLAAALGWTLPAECPGRDLAALAAGGGNPRLPADGEPLVLENLLYGPQQLGFLHWPWLRVGPPAAGGGAWYDLAASPGAFAPIVAPAEAPALEAAGNARRDAWASLAERLRREDAHRTEQNVPEAIRRRLRSLGY